MRRDQKKLINLDTKHDAVHGILKVECGPVEAYCMGTASDERPRLDKVVLPCRCHWLKALANARLLRNSQFSNLSMPCNMTIAERHRVYELRQEASDRNRKANARLWVVYRG